MTTYTSAPIPTLKEDDELVFIYKGVKYNGDVSRVPTTNKWFVNVRNHMNSEILRAVFSDYSARVSEIYGYPHQGGDWPLARGIEDLTRLVRAVFIACDSQETVSPAVGMHVRGLRSSENPGVITGVEPLFVRYPGHSAPIPQQLISTMELKWPWDSEWKRVAPQVPDLAKFQIWRHKGNGLHFIALATAPGSSTITLYALNRDCSGSFFNHGEGFGSAGKDGFEFIGMADDVLTIKKKG